MKKALILLISLLVIVGVGRALLKLPAVQDTVLERGTALIAKRGTAPLPESESLRVYVCGSASPLGMGQAPGLYCRCNAGAFLPDRLRSRFYRQH